MGNLLYVIAVILVISWAIGFFGYHAGGIIHVLLVIAIIAFLLKVVRSMTIFRTFSKRAKPATFFCKQAHLRKSLFTFRAHLLLGLYRELVNFLFY